MKRKVELSTNSVIITVVGIAFLAGLMIVNLHRGAETLAYITLAYIIAAVLVIFSFVALFFMPLSLSVDEEALNINTSLRVKSIPLKEITSISLCPPTMSERRIFGSGGMYGYWGWFSEPSIGKYMAYYGKASDCFLVRRKDGKQYMLSCKDPLGMMEYINSKLSQ